MKERFREPFSASYRYRQDQHDEMDRYIETLLLASKEERRRYFRPSYTSEAEYEASLEPYRREFRSLIGMPGGGFSSAEMASKTRIEQLGEDAHKSVFRTWIPVAEGLTAYGLYLRPKTQASSMPTAADGRNPHRESSDTAAPHEARFPLIVACHGGSGCPEAICDLDTREPYHGFGAAAAEEGYAVWAPLVLMTVGYGGDPKPPKDRYYFDRTAMLVGLRIVGIEVFKIIQGMEALLTLRPELDATRVGMTGLSYGGYFTLCTAAVTTRVRAAACSAFYRSYDGPGSFVRRDPVSGSDGRFHDGLNRFDLSNTAGLICPRPLLIQNGSRDTVISAEGIEEAVDAASAFYRKLGVPDRFVFHLHEGGHEYDNDAVFGFFGHFIRTAPPAESGSTR